MGAGAIAGAKGGFAGAALGALGGAICFVADEIHEYMMQPQPQPQSQQEDGSVKPKDH